MIASPRRTNRSSTKPQRALEPKSYAEPDLDLETLEEDEDQVLVKPSTTPSSTPSSSSSSSNVNSAGSATRSRNLRKRKPASSAASDKDKDIGANRPSQTRRSASKSVPANSADSTGSGQHFVEGELSDADDGVTRCVCGLQPDDHDGIMIQCEDCAVWQHGICIGIPDLDSCPEKYYCERCRPHMHPVLGKVQGARFRRSQSSSLAPTPSITTKSKSPKKRNTANSRETEQTPTSAPMLSLSPEAIMKEYGIPKPMNPSGSSLTATQPQSRTKANSRKRSRQNATPKLPKSEEQAVIPAAQDSNIVDPLNVGAPAPRRNSTSESPIQDAKSAGRSGSSPSDFARVNQSKIVGSHDVGAEGTKRARSPSPDISRANDGDQDTTVSSKEKGNEDLQTTTFSRPGTKRRRTTKTCANPAANQNIDLSKDSKGVNPISTPSVDASELSQTVTDKEEPDLKQTGGSKRRKTGTNSTETPSKSIPDTTSNVNSNSRRSSKKSTSNTRGTATTPVPTMDTNTILVPPTYITSTRRSGKQSSVTSNNQARAAQSGATPPPSISSHPYYEALGDLVRIRAKVRQPHSRMSLGEMNKRAKLMLDYITRIQMERAEFLERQEMEDARAEARKMREMKRRERREKLADRKLKTKGKRKLDAVKVQENGNGNLDVCDTSESTTTTTATIPPLPAKTIYPIMPKRGTISEPLKDGQSHSKGLDDIILDKNGKNHLNGTKHTPSTELEKPVDESLEMMDNLTRDIIKFQKRFPTKGRGTKF